MSYIDDALNFIEGRESHQRDLGGNYGTHIDPLSRNFVLPRDIRLQLERSGMLREFSQGHTRLAPHEQANRYLITAHASEAHRIGDALVLRNGERYSDVVGRAYY